ncbi:MULTISPECIES: phage head morphogenesis protein [unclassified Caballeronia]|uniref:phage head morphogenesis protein n=1 Tax=unclassified Caballeronia TaxID=2646786 RepID=UPI001F2D332E|nr:MULTISPECIES: phage head morphogenesis protein [unclassified Caballeronia]MCE4545110.1 phage head morphogenesis protein [Caballeronia sp. PC1]MCE4570535.1 phage head morphogenesis protein [Caballeronia sp. CLC5]
MNGDAPSAKPVTLVPVRPNQGFEAAFRRRLTRLVDLMHTSLVYWLRACWRANESELAQDASPARVLRRTIAKLSRRWQRRFDEIALALAQRFADSAMGRADGAFQSSLKRAGFVVDFRLTREANDAPQATIGANVVLIRSIAAEPLADAEGIVMRRVQPGQALGDLTNQLQERYGFTRHRAALIARDQNSKATATVVCVRQEGLGITEAIWLRSHGGKHLRCFAPRCGWQALQDQRRGLSRRRVDVAGARAELPVR